MLTINAPSHFVCDSAHELFIHVLQAFHLAEEVSSVADPNSVGSFWGLKNRPTKELRYVTLVLKNPRNRWVGSTHSPIEDLIARAVLCALTDEIELSAIGFYNPRAFEFSDDGFTIPSNYGHRVRHFRGVDQMKETIDLLREDPNSRRAVIHIHDVGDCSLKYTPCINSLHFLIRNGALECHSLWRSENALTLLPVNLFEFTLLQELIASELGVGLGPYAHTVSSLHCYLDEEHRRQEMLERLSLGEVPQIMPQMSPHSLQQMEVLKSFEKKLRLQQEDGMHEYSKLSDYWKGIADILGQAIAKKLALRGS